MCGWAVVLLSSCFSLLNNKTTAQPYIMPHFQGACYRTMSLHNIQCVVLLPSAASDLFYHTFHTTTDDVSVHVEIRPADPSVQFLVLVRFDAFPRLSGDDVGWDFLQTVPRTMHTTGEWQRSRSNTFTFETRR